MARKGKSSSRGKQRMSKIEPSAMTIALISTPVAPGAAQTNYVDLSQLASLVNRRFYRQGINWAVAGFKFQTSAGYIGGVNVSKLPNTWVMANSWEKSMRVWMRMNKEALQESESVRPRFLDFKIFADADHHAAGYGANLLPTSRAIPPVVGATYLPGEWAASKVVHPLATGAVEGVTVESELVAVGPSYPGLGASGLNAVSLIEGYAASRAAPNVLDPNVPADSRDTTGVTPENWMQAIFNDGTDQDFEVLTDMINDNNIAPYPFVNDGANPDTMYPGGANQGSGMAIHDAEYITATTIGGTTRLKGGNFPCGLIRFDFNNSGEAGQVGILIDLIPGNHRGYLCEPMTEM